MTELSNKYIVMPSFVKGIINLRGEVTPIIDLKERLNIPASNYTDEAKVLIVKFGKNKVGLIVDFATDVQDIDHSLIVPPPNIFGDENQVFVKGIANLETRILTLLSFKELFTSKEIEKIQVVQ